MYEASSWLPDMHDKLFVYNFNTFAGIDHETVVKDDLDPEDDFEYWLKSCKDELDFNKNEKKGIVSGKRLDANLLFMKYDGHYSGYGKFIRTLVKAFRTMDSRTLVLIESVIRSLYIVRKNIIDYNSNFLVLLHDELQSVEERILFASIMKWSLMSLDFMDVCITDILIDSISKELTKEKGKISKDAKSTQLDFLKSKQPFSTMYISGSNLERAISSVVESGHYNKITTYIELLPRFKTIDQGIKRYLIFLLSAHLKYNHDELISVNAINWINKIKQM